jgi:hypothetical protein
MERWGSTAGVALFVVLALACSRPRPTYEYGPTETYTSTAKDPTPRRIEDPAAHVASSPPVRAGQAEGTEAPSPAPSSSAPAPAASAPAPAASAPAPAASAPAPPAPVPAAAAPPPAPEAAPTPGRWYKAKPW